MSQVLIEIPEPQPSATHQDYPNTYTAIPPNGKVCPHTGLKHAQLYKMLTNEGAARPYVRVVSLKEPGALKGKTVFHVGDMLRYLDRLADAQRSGAERKASDNSPRATEH